MTEWFDKQWEEERQELADLEYSEVLLTDDEELELDEGIEECSCEVSEKTCPLHNSKIDEE